MELPEMSGTEVIAIVIVIITTLQKFGLFKKLEKGNNALDDIKITEIVESKIKENFESDANEALMKQKIVNIVDEKINIHTLNTSDNVLEKIKTTGEDVGNHHKSIEKMCMEIEKIKSKFETYDLMVDNNKDSIKELKKRIDKIDNKIDTLTTKMIPYKNVYGDIE